jgi:Sec-independent protein translocase protein TatA
MGIGVLEIVILVVIVLIVFGGYRRLPQLGRSAGTGARKGGEKAKEMAGQLRTKAEGVDTKKVSESVGKGIREAREVRDTVKGIASGEEPAGEEKRPAPASGDSGGAGGDPERNGERADGTSEGAEGAGEERPTGR